MDTKIDILILLADLLRVLADHPGESLMLAVLVALARWAWRALRFVLSNAASYLLTERVLKRLWPPEDIGGEEPAEAEPAETERIERLARELGQAEAEVEWLREQLRRERRRPWWRRLFRR